MAHVTPAKRFFGPIVPRLIRQHHRPLPILLRRNVSANEKPLPTKDTPGKGPHQDQLPHVSEEAAQTGKITGEGGPELDQGTPVQEMLQRDKEASKNAPEVLKDSSPKKTPTGTRSFSTTAHRSQPDLEASMASSMPNPPPPSLTTDLTPALSATGLATPGLKFAPVPLPGRQDHLKMRYPEIISRSTRLIMQGGKLARAQTNMARILNFLRTSPPPSINPERPLHPDSPPASQLPLNPVEYFTTAIDSIAPVLRLQGMKGVAGGGQSLQIPKPLTVWQRRRQAMVWILDAVSKKRSKGSGKDMFARKFADELVAIVEGKSPLWERRQALHRLGMAARANLAKSERIRMMRGR